MDSTKKILIVVVAVVAVVAVAAVLFFVLSDNKDTEEETPEPTTNAYYDYELSTITSYVSKYGTTNNPSPGNIFVLAEITVKNIDYEPGINGDPYNYMLKYDNISYRGNGGIYSHPLHESSIYIMPGGQSKIYNLWTMPPDIDLENASVLWKGEEDAIVVYDPTLL